MRRALRTSLLAVPAALGLTVTTATSANAHYVYYADIIWSNADSSRCMISYSETSHGSSGGGYYKGESRSRAELSSFPSECVVPYEKNTGHLGEAFRIFKWYVDSAGDGSWLLCWQTERDWYKNSEPSSDLRLQMSDVPAEGLCGPGYYGLNNYAIMYDNGTWVGGSPMWSGYHWLPDGTPPEPEPTEPAPPLEIPPGGGSTSKASQKVGVLGKTGKPVIGVDGKPVKVNPAPELPDARNSASGGGGKRHTEVNENGSVTEVVELESKMLPAAR
ncbi:hypothetical protein [Streptomyces sp. NPDC005407]|uniref:hypothetical protein n=1 Tax=Streptomyces sp. NPDC005407 TaxID=3155340 RepID=UPI0033A43635